MTFPAEEPPANGHGGLTGAELFEVRFDRQVLGGGARRLHGDRRLLALGFEGLLEAERKCGQDRTGSAVAAPLLDLVGKTCVARGFVFQHLVGALGGGPPDMTPPELVDCLDPLAVVLEVLLVVCVVHEVVGALRHPGAFVGRRTGPASLWQMSGGSGRARVSLVRSLFGVNEGHRSRLAPRAALPEACRAPAVRFGWLQLSKWGRWAASTASSRPGSRA